LNVPGIDAEQAKIELIRNQEEEEKSDQRSIRRPERTAVRSGEISARSGRQHSKSIGACNNLIDNPIDVTDGSDLNRTDDK